MHTPESPTQVLVVFSDDNTHERVRVALERHQRTRTYTYLLMRHLDDVQKHLATTPARQLFIAEWYPGSDRDATRILKELRKKNSLLVCVTTTIKEGASHTNIPQLLQAIEDFLDQKLDRQPVLTKTQVMFGDVLPGEKFESWKTKRGFIGLKILPTTIVVPKPNRWGPTTASNHSVNAVILTDLNDVPASDAGALIQCSLTDMVLVSRPAK
ncbi:MAG: hypothetical protein RLZZ347_220 [Candidatus Parcubacteria bacterium]|jgi:hypothetical protein